MTQARKLADADSNLTVLSTKVDGMKVVTDKAFIPENIVGLVSQAGGLPTGAILERGSNANGEYIKFADGTLICWKVQSVTTNVTQAAGSVFFTSALNGQGWAFPFVSRPARFICSDGGTWSNNSTTDWSATNVGMYQLVRYANTPTESTYSVSIVGVGRWF